MDSIPQSQTALPESTKANGAPESHPVTVAVYATWENLPVDDKLRFVTGLVQLMGVGSGYILTQPIERTKWRNLVESGLVCLDEHDDYAIHLTVAGSVVLNELLRVYLPVENVAII